LVTKRMSPELSARVLDSVRGISGAGAGRRALKRPSPLVPLLRLTTGACVLAVLTLVLYARHQRSQRLERDRSALLDAVRQAGSSLSANDRQQRGRIEAALSTQAAAAYAGDSFAEELRHESRLESELALATVYVRGSIDLLATPARLLQAATSSYKDSLLLCLLDPPDERSEKTLKAKARAALTKATASTVMAHVERLDPLLQALPLLDPSWKGRIEAAENAAALATYQKLFDVAPLPSAVRAAKARQLLAVMDEPGDPTVPAELDGERRHAVRVTLTDLSSGQVRLRYRGAVDPSWLSEGARAEHASGIDGCSLALDFRKAVLGR